jgi:hypothetical protein
MLLGLRVGIAPACRPGGQEMDGCAAERHYQAQIEVVSRFIEGILVEGTQGRIEMVLCPKRDARRTRAGHGENQEKREKARMPPRPTQELPEGLDHAPLPK